jgi:hypothetical protein
VIAGRFTSALAAIDAANEGDPHTITIDGATRPKEQAHAELMTDWVGRLDPDADELQLLAARAHHLRRWATPRDEYPEGRAGYLRWRRVANRRQADEVGRIMQDCGYDARSVERVQQIIRKEHLRTDAKVQTHEDALCLVFLQTQLTDLVEQLGDAKAPDVLRKTLEKMSPRGRAEARALAVGDDARALIIAALQDVDG